YLATLRPLLRGGEASVAWRGRTAPAHHLMPDAGFVAFEPRIPLYVSSFGPRSLELAAKHGDGMVTSVPPVPRAMAAAWTQLETAAAQFGRTIERGGFPVAALSTVVLLADAGDIESPRVKEDAGAFAMAS